MSRRLAAVLLGAALAACSAPSGKTCTQTSDCGAGNVCTAGVCQVAIVAAVVSGPAVAVASSSATFQFSSTPAGATFECSLDGAPFAACTNPVTFTGLADGPHSLDVRARNTENISAPTSWAWQVDTTPPNTAIDSGPSGTVIGAVSIAFSSPEATATFECALDGAAWAACTSPQAFSAPALGTHSFQVRALDALGNADLTPAQRGWSTAADTTITAQPVTPIASSSASFQFIASDASATFECRLDSASFSACSSPMPYSGLADGSHTFQVRATGGGVADPTPASYTWTVDTTGPVVNLTGTPAATQSENPSFTFSSPEGTATFECRMDAGTWAPCTSPKSYTVPGTLAPGAHTFYVRGKDTLGNYTASPQSYPWNQAPETSITCAPLAATNRAIEKVAFTSNVGSATFECQLDTGTWTACTSPRAWSLTYTTHTVSVRAVAGGVTDPTPAITTFAVTTSPLLYYNFEYSGANGGALAGYTALLEGGGTSPAPPTYVGFSHGLNGLNGLSFTATSSSSTGWVRIPGARTILSHDCEASDASYTISMYYQEPNPPNYLSAGFLPAILNDRGNGGGFQTYHGAGASTWTTCFDTWSGTVIGSGCFTVANPGLAATHTFTMEYAYNSGTQGNDLKIYFDGGLYSPIGQTTSGVSIFNPYQTTDLYIGKDWYGFIDAVRVYNTTKGGVVP